MNCDLEFCDDDPGFLVRIELSRMDLISGMPIEALLWDQGDKMLFEGLDLKGNRANVIAAQAGICTNKKTLVGNWEWFNEATKLGSF